MEETTIYKGYKIDISHSDFNENPFKEWEGNVPLMYKSGSNAEDYSNGNIISFISGKMTDNQIIHHQKAIAEIFEIDLQYYKDYNFDTAEKISEIRTAIEDFDKYSQLADFCELAKIKHLQTNSTGYSQGDYAHIFICETPEFFKETGCTELTEEMMESGAELWGHWAWGDVYSFSIENGSFSDSCGGFYGTDHDKSGLMEHAKDAIDGDIKYRSKGKFDRLKQLIKAHVPQLYRPQILAEFNL